MIRSILLVFVTFVSLLHQGYSQNTVGLLSFDNELSSDGFNLIYPNNQSTVFLLNNCGEIVNTWEDSDVFRPGNSAYLLENGNLLKTKRNINSNQAQFNAPGGGEIVEVRSWDNQLISSFELNNNQQRIHHDIEPLPNGNVLMITWEFLSNAEAIQAGRDPRLLPNRQLWSEAILELNPDTGEIVWEWHSADHFIQDFDSQRDNFGDPGVFSGKIDINYDENNGNPDWLHFNALDYNPVLDQILISSPYFNEVWIIDHSTTTEEAATNLGGNSGLGGQLIYRWGNDKAFVDSGGNSQQLFFQHNPNWADPQATVGDDNFGRIIVYNNQVSATSSAVTFIDPVFNLQTNNYELNGDIYLPNEPSRTITLNGISSSSIISSAQLLPNDNVLAMSGLFGFAFEFDPNDNVIWQYIIPIANGRRASQGDILSQGDNFTFRFERYAADYPAFEGRDLSAKGFIENRPNENFCTLSTSTQELLDQNLAFIDQNLVGDQLTVFNAPQLSYQIISVNGIVVDKGVLRSDMELLNVQHLMNGIYYLRIDRQRAIAFGKF